MDHPTFATKTYNCVPGVDVGKLSHWACAVSSDGEELLSEPVANTEPELDALLAGLLARTLVVVDQRRNIGTLVTERARAAGMDVAYLPGIVEHKVAEALPGIAKTDSVDAGIIATAALGMPRMLRPIPEEDPALEAVRVMAAERLYVRRFAPGSPRTPRSSPSSTRRSRERSPTTGATAICSRTPASTRRPRPSS